jgi:hypothetical protein
MPLLLSYQVFNHPQGIMFFVCDWQKLRSPLRYLTFCPVKEESKIAHVYSILSSPNEFLKAKCFKYSSFVKSLEEGFH